MTIANVLYVFVEIGIDLAHLVSSVDFNLEDKEAQIYLMGIVQFNTTLVRAKQLLEKDKGFKNVNLPQTKPRSKGEVLGCTSPVIDEQPDVIEAPSEDADKPLKKKASIVIFIGDGRFHIESCMIRNPHLIFYQYDPFKQ
jgi:2-(3-amino-3-carboxypropyl)histidine synthase